MDGDDGMPPSEHSGTPFSQFEEDQEQEDLLREEIPEEAGESELPEGDDQTDIALLPNDSEYAANTSELEGFGTEVRTTDMELEDSVDPELDMVGAEVAPVTKPSESVEELPLTAQAVDSELADVMPEREQPSYGVQTQLDVEDITEESSQQPTAESSEVETHQLSPNEYIVSADIEVSVFVTVQPMGFQVTVKAPGGSRGDVYSGFLYECIASRFGVHPESLRLRWRGERLRFGVTVPYEAGPGPREGRLWIDAFFNEGMIPEHLMSIEKDNHYVRCVTVRARLEQIGPSDLISARRRGLTFDEAINEVRESTKPQNYMTISIVHDPMGIRLPFLGGYRLKKDHSRIFRHAATQLSSPGDTTLADLQYGPIVRNRVSRKTQTYGVSRSTQTLREGRTQTARPDYEVDEKFDEAITAKPYFSSQELLALQSTMIAVIQKMYRKWKARRVFREVAALRQDFLNKAAQQAAEEEAEKRRREEFELRRRAVPRTADDFKTLRKELEAWRAAEAERILADTSLSEAQKRTALTHLTNKEVKLLRELETLRGTVLNNRRMHRFETILQAMTCAKDCGPVSVTTQAAERACELRQLYASFTEPPKTVEGRLDILLHVKWTVKEFDVPLTRQIVELIDREADLLQRGRTMCSLKGLHTRLENLLKRFIATPEYNPAVEEVVRGPKFGVADGLDAPKISSSRRLKPSNVL
ncbi:hypothetical protein DPX39_070036500 [Trypanosoma brucei equiperdum]|uniref:IQ motif and ubiquitin-like domain-containing protein n=1 Tax=Trypanosoma brucei equiperdum TaxID=630700 RepID=A0A3L6L665_9TRYP|nr:hypothetical protein DPX39_070036500 [Trypanosoma brucei equiperdum]